MGKVKLLIMDVDGTLTDGKIHMSAAGELFKTFDIKDGCGIRDVLPMSGIIPVVMTARESIIVEKRCKELGIIHCYQGCRDKKAQLKETAKAFHIRANKEGIYLEIAYIGDDIIDIPCMRCCGVVGCPADATMEVQKVAQFVSTRKGGEGAVREFIEWLIKRNAK